MDTITLTLSKLNAMDRASFVARLGAVFEHSPWVADAVWPARPFASIDELHRAMIAAVEAAPLPRRLALLQAHPELAGQEAQAGRLTPDSTSEQGRLGLQSLSASEFARIGAANRAYREKFGFPCIVALRLHANRASVLDVMERRLCADRDTEIGRALAEVYAITRGRLATLIAAASTRVEP